MATNQEMLSWTYEKVTNLANDLLPDGTTYRYGILPIIVETQRRQAVNHSQTMAVLSELANNPDVTVERIEQIVNTATDRAIAEINANEGA